MSQEQMPKEGTAQGPSVSEQVDTFLTDEDLEGKIANEALPEETRAGYQKEIDRRKLNEGADASDLEKAA